MSKEALVIIDVQNDFCPGGKLAVKDGDKVIGPLNLLIADSIKKLTPVIATRDWHPEKTSHFSKYGGLWPEHCVQNSDGGNFHPELNLPPSAEIFSKGMGEFEDSYSGFAGKNKKGLDLDSFLRNSGIEKVLVGGLATDYCVLQTVLEARKRGFAVIVLEDAIRAVDLQEGDGEKAIKKMEEAGAQITSSLEVIRS